MKPPCPMSLVRKHLNFPWVFNPSSGLSVICHDCYKTINSFLKSTFIVVSWCLTLFKSPFTQLISIANEVPRFVLELRKRSIPRPAVVGACHPGPRVFPMGKPWENHGKPGGTETIFPVNQWTPPQYLRCWEQPCQGCQWVLKVFVWWNQPFYGDHLWDMMRIYIYIWIQSTTYGIWVCLKIGDTGAPNLPFFFIFPTKAWGDTTTIKLVVRNHRSQSSYRPMAIFRDLNCRYLPFSEACVMRVDNTDLQTRSSCRFTEWNDYLQL